MKYEIRENEQFKSTEILFDGKPSEKVREILKSNGYRWHGVRRLWYGYKTAEEIKNLLSSASESELTEQNGTETAKNGAKIDERAEAERKDKEEQKRLKNAYLDGVAREIWQNNEKMIAYYDESTARVYETTDGDLIAIEKPSINTSFCFGYGQNGVSNDEDEERAYNMAEYARKNENYFISENLKKFSWWLDFMKERPDEIYTRVAYYKSPEDSKIKAIAHFDAWKWQNLPEKEQKQYKHLSPDDVNGLIKAYEIEQKNFEKRLRAYLKRYGTSKLKTWSYLVD